MIYDDQFVNKLITQIGDQAYEIGLLRSEIGYLITQLQKLRLEHETTPAYVSQRITCIHGSSCYICRGAND